MRESLEKGIQKPAPFRKRDAVGLSLGALAVLSSGILGQWQERNCPITN